MKDEFAFIRNITPANLVQPSLVQGIGDDAAVYAGDSAFEEVVTMDTMVEDVHFSRRILSPYDIGFKAAAVNISDIAAMGGTPTYCLVSVAVPPGWRNDLEEVYRGIHDLTGAYQIDLIGGDTVSAKDAFVITITALGRVKKGGALLRSHARPGDRVFVTGPLGSSAAGLELLLKHGRTHAWPQHLQPLIEAHQRPRPQVEAGKILSDLSVRAALNDISDGLASEAAELAEASGVSLLLDYDKIPNAHALAGFPKEKQEHWVLNGGEDFQLVGTVPASAAEEWSRSFPVTFIGKVEEGPPRVLLNKNGNIDRLEKQGYNHFKR